MAKQREIITNKSNISTETQEQRKIFRLFTKYLYVALKGTKTYRTSHSNPLKVSTWHILYSGVDVANI